MKASEALAKIEALFATNKEEAPVEASQPENEVALAQETLENGTVLEAEAFEANAEVFIVNEDERIAVPVGEYELADGRILVVAETGIIAEVREAGEAEAEEAPAEEEVVEEEMSTEQEATPKKVVESTVKETHFVSQEEFTNAINEIKEMFETALTSHKNEVETLTDEADALRAELSTESAAEPIKHNPEANEQPKRNIATRKPSTALNRVLSKLNK